jgi:hypothetical protein
LQKQDAEASKQQREYELLNKQKQLGSKTLLIVYDHVFGVSSILMYMAYLVFSDEYENCPICNDGRTEIISFCSIVIVS